MNLTGELNKKKRGDRNTSQLSRQTKKSQSDISRLIKQNEKKRKEEDVHHMIELQCIVIEDLLKQRSSLITTPVLQDNYSPEHYSEQLPSMNTMEAGRMESPIREYGDSPLSREQMESYRSGVLIAPRGESGIPRLSISKSRRSEQKNQ